MGGGRARTQVVTRGGGAWTGGDWVLGAPWSHQAGTFVWATSSGGALLNGTGGGGLEVVGALSVERDVTVHVAVSMWNASSLTLGQATSVGVTLNGPLAMWNASSLHLVGSDSLTANAELSMWDASSLRVGNYSTVTTYAPLNMANAASLSVASAGTLRQYGGGTWASTASANVSGTLDLRQGNYSLASPLSGVQGTVQVRGPLRLPSAPLRPRPTHDCAPVDVRAGPGG